MSFYLRLGRPGSSYYNMWADLNGIDPKKRLSGVRNITDGHELHESS